MIKLINLSKTYLISQQPVSALKNINLHVSKGEIFGVIGPSGAGKSTLIRSINLLERPTSGQVIVDNQDLLQLNASELRKTRQKIGKIFQHFNLLSSRTAYENIALPLELADKSKTEIKKTVLSTLELVGLQDKTNFYPAQLSGGQKQRVAIARALANQPHLLLCDEMTSALDPQTTHSILQLLKNINKKLGLTILLITHEMNVVKEICDRLAILQNGEIIETSEVIPFFSQPKSTIAKEFVRSSLKQHLPDNLQKRILPQQTATSVPLLQISFFGQAAAEPFIADLIQRFNINLNILQANIENIHEQIVGIMLVEAAADKDKIDAAIEYLKDKNIMIEVIGYVERNH
jgi:D-methionine transport system ATP-binding protein